ncbi:hypothetical protein GPDM_03000 [Planococcus donghaensis MPA1U2]|uniref:O-antigen ligase-related domain-containing protein n=1 Tax=Planococcus donghaensis MPA1U2 TaxID=933115 RepID=E7RDS2_9BACL|nr:O-antigen ligase family protein [Planococcus donghaensis]EGA90828.1 hypothetical protein GPDM_03000 [Planococcus donghaensis MPA1U2]
MTINGIRHRYEKRKIDKIELFMIFILNFIFLFHEMMNNLIIFSFGITWFFWFLIRNKRKYTYIQIFSFLLCIYVPSSFVSILGTSYSSLPITWFNLILFCIVIIILTKGFKPNFYFYSIIIFFLFGFSTLFQSIDVTDTLKQLFTIILFLTSFFIGDNLIRFSDDHFLLKLKRYYIISVVSFSTVVFIQRGVYEVFSLSLGNLEVIGQSRIVSAGTMGDYSFATLYIATGLMIILLDYFNGKKVGFLSFIFLEVYLILSILAVNSRTGLFAFLLVSAIYLLLKLLKGNLKAIFILASALLVIPSIFQYIIASRGGQPIFEGSGRFDLIIISYKIFAENPFFGVGLGIANWTNITGMVLPHNMIAQYLVQLGIFGSILFYSNFLYLLKRYLKYKSELFWVLIVILIGAMVIPDIVSSRFLTVIVIITILSSDSNRQLINRRQDNEESRKNITVKHKVV